MGGAGQSGGIGKGWGDTPTKRTDSISGHQGHPLRWVGLGQGKCGEGWMVSLCEGDCHMAKAMHRGLAHSRCAGTGSEIQSHQLGIIT